jgi:hypothetical protein
MTLDLARAQKWALGLAALIGLGTLRVGYFVDDYVFKAVVKGLPWIHQGGAELYTLGPGDPAKLRPFIELGPYPWWTDEDFAARFFRPVSSLTMTFDYGFDATWPGHVQSALWWLLIVAAVCALMPRLLLPRAAAIAVLLFAVEDSHFVVVTWVANRHALVSSAFALWGFWAWLRGRQDGAPWGLPLATLLFALALCSGESAMGVLAFVGAWELFGRDAPLRDRVRGLVPLAVLGLAYVINYKLGHYGTKGSDIYLDPSKQPLDFLIAAPLRFLTLLAPMTLNFPADLYAVDRRLALALGATGASGALLWSLAGRAVWASLEAKHRGAIRWLCVGCAASMVPVLAAWPSDRLLFATSFGACALLAMLVDAAFATGRWKKAAVAALVLQLVPAAIIWVGGAPGLAKFDAAFRRVALEVAVSDEAMRRRVIMVTAPDLFSAAYVGIIRFVEGKGHPRTYNILSAAGADHRLTRTAESSFELETVGGPFLRTSMERLFRNPVVRPFAVGETAHIGAARVTVLALTDGLPARIRVELEEPLDQYTLVRWESGKVRPLALPEVGQALTLSKQPGPVEEVVGLSANN